jgi:hypothetical protein
MTDNSKPSIEFDGASDHLDVGQELFGDAGLDDGDMSIWAVASLTHDDGAGDRYTLIGEGTASAGNYFTTYGDKLGAYSSSGETHMYRVMAWGGGGLLFKDTTNMGDGQFIVGYTWGGTTHRISSDDATPDTSTTAPATSYYNNASIGAASSNAGSERWDGKISEIVQWHSDQESNRSDILSDINTFYGAF